MSSDDALYCLAIIPARGGSKGLPGKNLADLGGKSLVARAVESALTSQRCSRVICSTDSEAIAAEAIQAGADVPFVRPAKLATDTAGSLDVVRHAMEHVEGERGRPVDLVCLLEPTTPLRTGENVREAIDLLIDAGDAADSAVSVCEVTDAHPAWLRKIEAGLLQPYFPQMAEPTRRQDLAQHPVPYRRNGAVYVTRRDVVAAGSLYGQRCVGYVMDDIHSINIDTELDLLCARAAWEFLNQSV